MKFNYYFKSDLIYDSPGKMEEMTMKLWSRVWQLKTGCLFKFKKKNSLSSSLFEYVIICELGHQTEFPASATFTRSHSSAVCMNHYLLARVVCTWWRGKGERQFRYEGSIVFPYSSQSNRLASLVWCLFFLSLKLLNPFYGLSNISINVWCFSPKEWSVLSKAVQLTLIP